MKKLIGMSVACVISAFAFAENHVIDELSTLDAAFYFEGDTITLPDGTYKLMGDAIATIADKVISCRKSGFTLLNDGSADHRLCVVPQPPAGGDVFYWKNTDGNGQNWTSVTWTKVTQNTDRAYPNDANDIAVVEGGCNWAKMVVDAAISVHGYVVGASKVNATSWMQICAVNGQSMTFCGTSDDPAYIRLSTLCSGKNGDFGSGFRVGSENKNDGSVLTVNVDAPRLLVDFCGDSAAVSDLYRRAYQFQHASAVINVPEGHEIAFVNSSKKEADQYISDKTKVGRFGGGGKIVVAVKARMGEIPLKNENGAFAGVIEACDGMLAATPPAGSTVRIVGSRLADPNFQQKNMGFASMFMPTVPGSAPTYDSQFNNIAANPGNFTPGLTLYMDGGAAFFTRQQTSAWASGKEGQEAQDAATATNEFDLVLRGDGYFYGYPAHDTSGTYVRPGVFLKSVDNQYGTLTIHGFNFKRNDYSPTRGIVKIEDPSRYLVGSDPAEGDEHEVYKIIPWLTVKYNESGINEFSYNYCSSICFPCIAEDGTLVPPYSEESCVGGRTYMYEGSGRAVEAWKDNAVAYIDKSGDWVMKLSADKTLNALAIRNNKDNHYSDAQKGMMGDGRTLTLTSGALILNCNDVGVANAIGGPQYDNGGGNDSAKWMKEGRKYSGTLRFGNTAYVFDFWGHPDLTKTGDNRQDYDCIWANCIAPYGFVKAGSGELCIARDQKQIEQVIHVNSGILRLGYPVGDKTYLGGKYPDACDGCATAADITVHAGAKLTVESAGYAGEPAISKNATITLLDTAAIQAVVEIAEGADQTCGKLFIDGKSMPRGSYGASGSGADFVDDLHFAGKGVLTVSKEEAAGFLIIIR